MKKNIFTLAFICSALFANAQGSSGLIAHWDMNGTANDVSGSGNNGTAYNLTPAAGMDGVMGHAWYFNGSDSYIWVPYAPSMNIQKYSICAKLKVAGFYNGLNEGSIILGRGYTGPETGTYYLFVSDLPGNGDNHTLCDTTVEDFVTSANDFPVSGFTALDYTPHIIENKWYSIVATFNDTTFNLYVNNILVKSINTLTPGPLMGSTTDGINIGMNTFEPGYPYQFKGVMDDIRLYNRVLTDSEVIQYGDTVACGTISVQPVYTTVHVDSNAKLFVTASMTPATYQWQQEEISGYVDLINVPPYSGVTTDTLHFTGASTSLDGTKYRCIISNTSCSDTTNAVVLTVIIPTGTSNIISSGAIAVYPNPAGNNLTVQMPYTIGKGSIELINEVGQIIAVQNINGNTAKFDLNGLSAGVYIVRIELDGQIIYKKVLKDK